MISEMHRILAIITILKMLRILATTEIITKINSKTQLITTETTITIKIILKTQLITTEITTITKLYSRYYIKGSSSASTSFFA